MHHSISAHTHTLTLVHLEGGQLFPFSLPAFKQQWRADERSLEEPADERVSAGHSGRVMACLVKRAWAQSRPNFTKWEVILNAPTSDGCGRSGRLRELTHALNCSHFLWYCYAFGLRFNYSAIVQYSRYQCMIEINNTTLKQSPWTSEIFLRDRKGSTGF